MPRRLSSKSKSKSAERHVMPSHASYQQKREKKNLWVETRKTWLVFFCEVRRIFCEALFLFLGVNNMNNFRDFFLGRNLIETCFVRFGPQVFPCFWGVVV